MRRLAAVATSTASIATRAQARKGRLIRIAKATGLVGMWFRPEV
jgi:hypothetical protein